MNSAKVSLRFSFLFLAFGFYACADRDRVCVVGATQRCVGPSGCSGVQSCGPDESWGECVCEPGDDSGSGGRSEAGDGDGDGDDTAGDGDGDGDETGQSGHGGMGGDENDPDPAQGGDGGEDGNDGEGGSSSSGGSPSGGASSGGMTGDGDGDGDGTYGALIFDGSGIAVLPTRNDYDISGSFFVRQDSYQNGQPVDDNFSHTEVTPIEFSKKDLAPCVNGQIARVVFGRYSSIWGMLIGLELADGTGSWDATEYGVEGFAFELGGSVGDARLRFEAEVSGSDEHFCVMLDHAVGETGSFEVSFDDLVQNCYSSPGSAQFDPTAITSLKWLAMADDGSTSPVENFCLKRLEVR